MIGKEVFEREFGEYLAVEELGEGGFGKIYKVRHKSDPTNVYIYIYSNQIITRNIWH